MYDHDEAKSTLTFTLPYLSYARSDVFRPVYRQVGLCESSFLLFEYSIELLVEYSSIRMIPEVAISTIG